MEDKSQKLIDILKLVNDGLTKDDFLKAFTAITEYVKGIKDTNQKEFDAIHDAFITLQTRITEEKDSSLSDLKGQVNDTLQSQIEAVTAKLASVKDGYSPIKGKDYFDGANADETTIIAEILKQLPPYPVAPEPLLGEDFRNALESLQGEDRLDASAIRNLPEQTKAWTQGVLTATALYSLADVNVVGITPGQSILWNGNQWIAFTPASGSGGYQQPTSGTVNGINTVFTFATAPNVISVDGGRNMQKQNSAPDLTQNWTGTTTITLSVAPNSDIFAVA